MQELWLPVRGLEGFYEVSNKGQVYSLISKQLMSQVWLDGRYLACKLKGKLRKVHQLVAEAFISPRPDGMLCLHRDDDRSNNTLENLYWGTAKQNHADIKRNGNRQNQNGSNNPCAKLNEAQVIAIRQADAPNTVIARQYGVSPSLISLIKRRKVWAQCP